MIEVLNLGLCDYQKAYKIQLDSIESLSEKIILCSHPPIVTLGKKTQQGDLQGWKGDVLSIERGGRATYHGPGQVIAYPIVNLKERGQNLSGYLNALEKSMVETLGDFQIEAVGNLDRGNPEMTGVWVGDKKVASIGIAVKRWITYHGLAFNLFKDEQAFQGISPCGFQTSTMTSLEELLDQRIERKPFEEALCRRLISHIEDL